MSFCPPEKNCDKCPRLVAYRNANKQKFPNYHNGPVESFGSLDSQILVVGLAPGLNGANQTNRPFTNDYAGDVLYPVLQKYGFAVGKYKKIKNDGFELINVRVSNAVRCVPPQNKVTTDETKTCSIFLSNEITNMKNLKIILSLGAVSHSAVLRTLGYKLNNFKFAHNSIHMLHNHNLILIDSYHTSRYNINTGVLTYEMFEDIIKNIRTILENDKTDN